jgi:hypothetical protein
MLQLKNVDNLVSILGAGHHAGDAFYGQKYVSQRGRRPDPGRRLVLEMW